MNMFDQGAIAFPNFTLAPNLEADAAEKVRHTVTFVDSTKPGTCGSAWGGGTKIGDIDEDGIVTLCEGHTVAEMAALFTHAVHESPSMSWGMLRSALGVTWNDRTTNEFWDAVRFALIERRTVNAQTWQVVAMPQNDGEEAAARQQ